MKRILLAVSILTMSTSIFGMAQKDPSLVKANQAITQDSELFKGPLEEGRSFFSVKNLNPEQDIIAIRGFFGPAKEIYTITIFFKNTPSKVYQQEELMETIEGQTLREKIKDLLDKIISTPQERLELIKALKTKQQTDIRIPDQEPLRTPKSLIRGF